MQLFYSLAAKQPFDSISAEHDLLLPLLNVIETYQLPLRLLVSAIAHHHSNVEAVVNYLQRFVQMRSDKSLQELIDELYKSRMIPFDMLETIEKCLLAVEKETHAGFDLTKVRNALIRIKECGSSKTPFSATIDDLRVTVINMSNALYLSNGKKYKPRVAQVISLCVLVLSHGQEVNSLLEVLTGEGKSCIIAMFAAALCLQGKKVDIITSSAVLAKRDALCWKKFYGMFNLTVAHNTDTTELLSASQSKADKKRAEIYRQDIVYGTVSSFSADILREEFEMREIRGERDRLAAAIVDEVDMLMMDEGVQFTYLSHRLAVLRHIEPVLALVWSEVKPHCPYITEDGIVLFADVAKSFHIIYGCIDITKHQALQDQIDRMKDLELSEIGIDDMLSLVSITNESREVCVKAYILNNSGQLELVGNCDDDHTMSVLLSTRGSVHQLYSQKQLTEGVERVVLSQCDISHQDVSTNDGRSYCPGHPGPFYEVLLNLSDESGCSHALLTLLTNSTAQQYSHNMKAVLSCVDDMSKKAAMQLVQSTDIVSYLDEINKM